MKDYKIENNMNLTVIIPCLNEEKTISKVVNDFRKELPEAKIVVVDNNSTDRSMEIARQNGVEIIIERKRGKGYVLQTAFNQIDSDIYIVVDGDDTYPAEDVKKLIEPILLDGADMVVGSRSEHVTNKSMKFINRIGNILILNMLNICFSSKLKDVLSGYRVLTRNIIENIPISASGFEIETELTLQALVRNLRIVEVPINYKARLDGSSSKLKLFRDGLRILFTIITLMRDYRPFLFFSSLTILFVSAGVIAGSKVIYQYLHTGVVNRIPLAILGITLVIIGVVFFATGFIVSTINRRFREIDIFLRKK